MAQSILFVLFHYRELEHNEFTHKEEILYVSLFWFWLEQLLKHNRGRRQEIRILLGFSKMCPSKIHPYKYYLGEIVLLKFSTETQNGLRKVSDFPRTKVQLHGEPWRRSGNLVHQLPVLPRLQ